MAKVELVFKREKETKNTVRFMEEERKGQPMVIGALYVQKFFVGEADSITVTVDAED